MKDDDISSDEKEETHESYGLISASRFHAMPPQAMFGSALRHSTGVAIEIHHALKKRSLSNDWFHGRGCLIRIELSEAQFAQFLTTLNVGPGVPCTIKRLNSEAVEDCPEINERKRIEEEFKTKMETVGKLLDKLTEQARVMKDKKGTINKGDAESFVKLAEHMRAEFTRNVAFVQSQFNEAMDGIVTEAKADVTGYMNQLVSQLGVEKLKEKFGEVTLALEAPKV